MKQNLLTSCFGGLDLEISQNLDIIMCLIIWCGLFKAFGYLFSCPEIDADMKMLRMYPSATQMKKGQGQLIKATHWPVVKCKQFLAA